MFGAITVYDHVFPLKNDQEPQTEQLNESCTDKPYLTIIEVKQSMTLYLDFISTCLKSVQAN